MILSINPKSYKDVVEAISISLEEGEQENKRFKKIEERKTTKIFTLSDFSSINSQNLEFYNFKFKLSSQFLPALVL